MKRTMLRIGFIAAVGCIVSGGVLAAGRERRGSAATPALAAAEEKKGSDGAACSSNSECVHVCEGGSCCTAHEDTCTASSHCCGHQSCVIEAGKDQGKCP